MSEMNSITFREIGPDFVARTRAAVTCEVVDGIAVLYDQAMGVCHRLNPTATVIWLRLDGQTTVAQVVDEAWATFGTDKPRLHDDVLALVQHFGELGLLEGVTSRSEELFLHDEGGA